LFTNCNSQEKDALVLALRCVYLPLPGAKELKARELVESLQRAFSWCEEENVDGNYETCWANMHEQSFGRKPIDFTLEVLRKREQILKNTTVEKSSDKFLELENWKEEELKKIEDLVDEIIDERSDNPFQARIKVKIGAVTFVKTEQLQKSKHHTIIVNSCRNN
jgi:hypothetical protein